MTERTPGTPLTIDEMNRSLEAHAESMQGKDGSQCPRRPPGPCHVNDWVYETVSIHPRMYGRCMDCETRYIVFLPRRRFEADPEWMTAAGQIDHIFIDASEHNLLRTGKAQHLWYLLNEHPLAVTRDILFAMRHELMQYVREREKHLEGLTSDLWARIRHYEEETFKVSRKALRGGALKAREALLALREQIKRERPEAQTIRAEINAAKRELRVAIEAARREPLPMPADYVPPSRVIGVILCDELSPPEVIYALVDPADPELVRYVGKTVDPVVRYATHCTAGAEAVTSWARSVREAGRKPTMVLLERCAAATVDAREAYWIHHYRDRFQADLNRAIPRRKS